MRNLAKDTVYDPFWEYEAEEWERQTLNRLREVKRNAVNERGSEGNEKHEENLQGPKEGEGSILRVDQQKEKGVRKLAPVKKRKKRKHPKKEKPHGKKNDDANAAGKYGSQEEGDQATKEN